MIEAMRFAYTTFYKACILNNLCKQKLHETVRYYNAKQLFSVQSLLA